MADQRLDLKYRPKKFSDVLGNSGIVQLLLKRSQERTLCEQSMLFAGPKGCGKTTLSRIVAKAIFCTDLSDGEPCGECSSCIAITEDSSGDFEELDAASQGTVDKIRSMVRDTEYEGGRRVYLLDEAHRLTQQAQDAMLKAMEDRLLVFIMCTTEVHKIKASIRSRMEEYPVVPAPADALLARLIDICAKESIEAEPEALKIIAGMRDAVPRTCIRALSTINTLGPITVQSANEFLRIDDFKAIDRILTLLDQDSRKAFEAFDALASVQSPTWIRDQIVLAISSAMRFDIGAKPTYPVHTRFFQYRLHGWADLARILVQLDRPTLADIESALLFTNPSMSVSRPQAPPPPVVVDIPAAPLPTAPAPPAPAPPAPAPPSASPRQETPKVKAPEPSKKPRVMEIDGVKFSENENLTSLDSKIDRSPSLPKPETGTIPAPVEFGKDNVPITDKEWASGLIRRVKG